MLALTAQLEIAGDLLPQRPSSSTGDRFWCKVATLTIHEWIVTHKPRARSVLNLDAAPGTCWTLILIAVIGNQDLSQSPLQIRSSLFRALRARSQCILHSFTMRYGSTFKLIQRSFRIPHEVLYVHSELILDWFRTLSEIIRNSCRIHLQPLELRYISRICCPEGIQFALRSLSANVERTHPEFIRNSCADSFCMPRSDLIQKSLTIFN